MSGVLSDLRYAARSLVRSPGFSIVVILILALGIGVNTAIFTVLQWMLLRPLPYSDLERIVALDERHQNGSWGINFDNFRDWQRQSSVFEALALHTYGEFNLAEQDAAGVVEPDRVRGAEVTWEFFRVLGVQPMVGRSFRPEEDAWDGDRAVVLTYGLWQRRYGGRREVLGESLKVNGQPHTIVGVLGPDFRFFETRKCELFTTFLSGYSGRTQHQWNGIARLSPGASLGVAQAQISAIEHRLGETYPATNAGWDVRLAPLEFETPKGTRAALLVLMAGVGCVLLIACTNVAGLLLARSAARIRESAIRAALGASRLRLIRLVFAEIFLLSLLGASLGLLLAVAGLDLLSAAVPPLMELSWAFRLDRAAFAFAAGLALLTSILAGLGPALSSGRLEENEVLKQGTRGAGLGPKRSIHLNGLVVAEVSLAMMLLVGAGLLIRSFAQLMSVEMGFQKDHVLTMLVEPFGEKYKTMGSSVDFYAQLLERVRSLPSVESAGGINQLPMSGWWIGQDFEIEGQPPLPGPKGMMVGQCGVSAEYFHAMNIALMKGRSFSEAEWRRLEAVAVINRTMALKYWPGEDPIGQHVRWRGGRWRTVIGTVADVRHSGPASEPRAELYYPGSDLRFVVVRTSAPPTSIVADIRAIARGLDPDLPVARVQTMEQVYSTNTSFQRWIAATLGVFAATALALSAIGLFGVLAYTVKQRTHEIGVRLALGAQPREILRLFVARGLRLTLLGLVVGLAGAVALSHSLTALLFGVQPTDAITFLFAPVLVVTVALAASFLPALSASRVDPISALRHE